MNFRLTFRSIGQFTLVTNWEELGYYTSFSRNCVHFYNLFTVIRIPYLQKSLILTIKEIGLSKPRSGCFRSSYQTAASGAVCQRLYCLPFLLLSFRRNTICAASWQNQQNGMWAQERLRSAQSDQSSLSTWRKFWVRSYPLSAQQRLWSDWADAQADLNLRVVHMPFCWFCNEAAHMVKPNCSNFRIITSNI